MSNLGNRKIMSENIRRLLKNKGVTRKQAAYELGIPYTTFNGWITLEAYPRVDRIDTMANYFGVKSSELTTRHYEYTDERQINEMLDRIVGFNGRQVTDKDRTILKDLIISYLKNQENDESHL